MAFVVLAAQPEHREALDGGDAGHDVQQRDELLLAAPGGREGVEATGLAGELAALGLGGHPLDLVLVEEPVLEPGLRDLGEARAGEDHVGDVVRHAVEEGLPVGRVALAVLGPAQVPVLARLEARGAGALLERERVGEAADEVVGSGRVVAVHAHDLVPARLFGGEAQVGHLLGELAGPIAVDRLLLDEGVDDLVGGEDREHGGRHGSGADAPEGGARGPVVDGGARETGHDDRRPLTLLLRTAHENTSLIVGVRASR